LRGISIVHEIEDIEYFSPKLSSNVLRDPDVLKHRSDEMLVRGDFAMENPPFPPDVPE
jgi:hypothetical protein